MQHDNDRGAPGSIGAPGAIDKKTDRREFLRCAAWSGTGLLWALNGGIPVSGLISTADAATRSSALSTSALSFVQISDTHIGFNKPANPDPIGTLRIAVDHIKALPVKPNFILHTGDITH